MNKNSFQGEEVVCTEQIFTADLLWWVNLAMGLILWTEKELVKKSLGQQWPIALSQLSPYLIWQYLGEK